MNKSAKPHIRKLCRRDLRNVLIGVGIIGLMTMLVLPVFCIQGLSMTPGLSSGDIVVGLKSLHYKPGDCIAFSCNNRILVKRVIARAGEWIDMDENGYIYVDGKKLEEPYVENQAVGECDISLPYQVPEGRVFVMGDHRSVSVDSRSSAVGCVSKEQIAGKLLFRVWPLKEIGWIR